MQTANFAMIILCASTFFCLNLDTSGQREMVWTPHFPPLSIKLILFIFQWRRKTKINLKKTMLSRAELKTKHYLFLNANAFVS